ncbi:hypothetical protein ACFWRT_02835 [Streptomyces cyaneofuscatus]
MRLVDTVPQQRVIEDRAVHRTADQSRSPGGPMTKAAENFG